MLTLFGVSVLVFVGKTCCKHLILGPASIFQCFNRMSIMAFTSESPEKVGLGIELKIFPLDVDVKLRCPGVGYTDNQREEISILTQFKRRCYHGCIW